MAYKIMAAKKYITHSRFIRVTAQMIKRIGHVLHQNTMLAA